jgi:hypothetical protein
VARHGLYYMGEGGGFPQVRVVVSLVTLWLLVVSLVSLWLPAVNPCTKVLKLGTNQLIV